VTHGLTMRLLLMRVFQWSVETFETVWNVDNCHHITLHKDMEQMCYKLCPEFSFPSQIPWATRPIWIVFKSREATPQTQEKLQKLMEFKRSMDGECPRQVAGDLEDEVSRLHTESLPLHVVGEVAGTWLEIDRAIQETKHRHLMERSEKYTVLDYLTIPQPRTRQSPETLKGRLVQGHGSIKDLCRDAALRKAQELPPIDWSDVELVDWWGEKLSYQGKMLRLKGCPSARRGATMTRHLSTGPEDILSSSNGDLRTLDRHDKVAGSVDELK